MSVPISIEKRLLSEAEFEVVQQTHYPDICSLSKGELAEAVRRIRDYRDKARDTSRQQRREMRGKARARGARPAQDNTGTSLKAQIFSSALRRANREIARLEQDERRYGQSDVARQALEQKRANRMRQHPSAGRTPRQGMRPIPNKDRTIEGDARQIGRASDVSRKEQAQGET